ncbi:MAG TPA: hypothetical protein VFN26_18795 [Candidatus Acidoferrum sp.]|nr:hypothetical protein [Candidatus Acidoferrum sp.]
MRHAVFTILLIIALLLLPATSHAQIPVDGLVNMDNVSPSAPGTQLSATILNNGTLGGMTWGSSSGTLSAMTVGPHQAACALGTSVTVGGSTYTSANNSQSYAYNNSSNFSWWTLSLGGQRKISMAGCITTPIANPSNVMDLWEMQDSAGHFVIIQLINNYCFRIETDGNGTLTSGCINAQAGVSYWCSLLDDETAGTAQLACFQPSAQFNQVGTTQTLQQKTGSNIITVRIGNSEAGTAAGTTYFENIIVDGTQAKFPLGVGTSNGTPPWSGILAPSRAIDWSTAGATIENRTIQCGATVPAGSTAATINAAIAACPQHQFVQLAAGSFPSLSGIDFTGHPNVTLRGMGADQTLLIFTGNTGCTTTTGTLVCIGGTDNNWKGGPSNTANWTAGYLVGSTQITLSSVANLKVGNPLILDQLDDDQTGCDAGAIFISQITTTCANPISPGIAGPFSLEGNGGEQRSGRQQAQIVIVAGCNGSTTPGFACSGTNVAVTISPGLYMPNWRAGQTPQAWWATSPITGDGVENLSIDGTAVSTGTGIQIKNATNSWVQGVRIIDTNRAHIQRELSAHITSRSNYEFLTQNSATQSYGDECFTSSDSLVENNVYHAIAGPILLNGACLGDVIAYNFAINMYYTPSAGWNEPTSSVHTAGVGFALYEGNILPVIDGDVFHGTHHFVTNFRNYQAGTQPKCYGSGSTYATSSYIACNNNLRPAQMHAFSRFFNYIGNILGTTGVQVGYQSGNPPIYVVGDGNSNGKVTVPGDPNVGTTLMRWGNYDTFNGAATFSSAEVPSSLAGVQAPFSNPLPASQTLPPSFFLNSKPSWWTAGKPWPAIGPDVTGGNVSGLGGHVYTIPAQDCYNSMGGLADGTGPVLTFNASKCYSGSTAILPAPPTGLKAIVH